MLVASLTAMTFLCSGCAAISREATNNGNLTQTEVVLDRKNYLFNILIIRLYCGKTGILSPLRSESALR